MQMKAEINGWKQMSNLLKAFPERIQRDVVNSAASAGATVVKNKAKQNIKANGSVDSGRLLKSVRTRKKKGVHGIYEVFTDKSAPHCLLGSRKHRVITENGGKQIGSIKPGEKVLTQTGEYRPVIAVNSFNATEKPNIVEIKVQRYKDYHGSHVLNLTEDHKVLVYRDGRNKWIQAGKLKYTDKLYEHKKIASNKTQKKCAYCGGSLKGPGRTQLHTKRKYCCIECRNNAFRENSPHLGMIRNEEARQNMSAAWWRKIEKNPNMHPNKILAKKGFVTICERQVEDWLKSQSKEYIKQFKVGDKFVDFYLPGEHKIIEADGAYWHQDQNIDIERDKYLLAQDPTLKIEHIHFFEKRFSPDINNTPLPNVFYIACNPNIDSYANPELMEPQEIISIKHWQYQKKGKRGQKLYDLMVDTDHSFFVNGILVSNSHLVEFGTGPRKLKKPKQIEIQPGKWVTVEHTGSMPAKPFFRPALDENHKLVMRKITERMAKRMAAEAQKMSQRYGTLSKTYRKKLLK